MRAAYNWRSDFLITPRDDIFPFSPIWQESSGQMDASIFYSVTDNVKLGIQGVTLLDSVTRTSQVVDFDGTRFTRRTEERRVGKECVSTCGSRWSQKHEKKKKIA